MQQYAKASRAGEAGGANASCQGNNGLFWALDFVDDENHSPPMVGLSPPPLLEVLNAELNV